jgi:choline-sulfatase
MLVAAIAASAAFAVVAWRTRPGMSPNVTRFRVIERLTEAAATRGLSESASDPPPHLRWTADEINTSWTRVQSGKSATLRSPRLDLVAGFHSIAIVRPASRIPMSAPILLWSDAPGLEGAAFARNRRELPVAQEPATVIVDAEALQSDQRQPIRYLFLHLPGGGAIDRSVESIAIVTTRDLAAAGPSMTRIAADGQTRDAFATTAPLTFRVDVPANAELAFGVRAPAGAPAAKVRVTQSFDGDVYQLFETTVTPGSWTDFRTRLREASGSLVTLSTDPVMDPAPVYWSVPLVTAPEASDNRPNIIIVVVDALRADAVGGLPFFDRLARESTVYRRAYAAASWTKPSIATLFTSLYPWTHTLGARYYADALPRNVLTLQSVLSAYGYVTVQFSANPFTGAASGLDRGFDTAFMAPALGHRDAFAVTAADVVDRFFGWVSARSQDRYFAYLHLVDTHGAKGVDGYRAAAGIADREIGRLYDRLNQVPGGANTLLVITADHGEAFGEHGQTGHGQSVYEEESRVPLIVHEPRQRAGRIVDEPVHLVDLMPTVLDYAGVAIDQTAIQGRSLRGNGREWKPSPVIITKFTYPDDVVVSGDRAEMHAVIDFPWKLIAIERRGQPRVHELYRLDIDPSERNNLARAEAARTRQLDAVLDAFLREQATARARFASTYERGVATMPAPPRELVDQLRSLGYVR